jgi:hypothetical protein
MGGLAEAAAQTDAPLAIAVALEMAEPGELVGNYGEMTFKMTPAESAPSPAGVLAERLVEAAALTKPERVYDEALALARRFGRKGPPRTYGKSGFGDASATAHPRVLTLLCQAAARVHATTGRTPDPAFDVMVEAELAVESSWPRLQVYLRAISGERLEALFLGLAERGFRLSWDESQTIDVEKVFDRVLEMLPDSGRERLLERAAEVAGAREVIERLDRFPSERVLERAAHKLDGELAELDEDERDEVIDESVDRLSKLGGWAIPVLERLRKQGGVQTPELFARALKRLNAS